MGRVVGSGPDPDLNGDRGSGRVAESQRFAGEHIVVVQEHVFPSMNNICSHVFIDFYSKHILHVMLCARTIRGLLNSRPKVKL